MSLKDQLIKLGHEKPELRDHLRPILSALDKKAKRPVAMKHIKDAVKEAFRTKFKEGKMKSVKVERQEAGSYLGKEAWYYELTIKHTTDAWHHFLENVRNDPDHDNEKYAWGQKRILADNLGPKFWGKCELYKESPRKTVYTLLLPEK
jgi:beta-glucosidase-like glycosyl hydrolase